MIIVTGGAGFIGSVLVKELNDKGHTNIIIVDRLGTEAKWKNLNGLKFAEFVHADDFLREEYEEYLNKANTVYHMGACSATTETDADYLMKNNWEFSKKIYLYCAHHNVKFCYASSAATYGAGDLGYSDDHSTIDNYRPLNMYGYSKQYFDQWILTQKRQPKKWCGLKFFNVYGPNEYHKGSMRSVVVQAFEQIKKTRKVKLFKSYKDGIGDGEQKRDFIYVKDVCRAMIALMDKEQTERGIFNMGTGVARSFNDLAQATFSALGEDQNLEFIEMPENLKGQYQYFTQADMGKFNRCLPDFKFHSLEDGIKDYVQNYLDTDSPYAAK